MRLPKAEIEQRLNILQRAVRSRMSEIDPMMLALMPSELDWMTATERAERHALILQLPSSGEERKLAKERLKAKHATRRLMS